MTPLLSRLLPRLLFHPGPAAAWAWLALSTAHAAGTPASPCAAAPLAGERVALERVIDLALCNNPKTRQSWIAAKVAAAQVGLAQAPYRPEVRGSAEVARSETRNVPNGRGVSSLEGSVSLNYLLFDFGGRDAALSQAQAALAAADWTHNATLQSVMLEATSAYYQLAAADEALQSARTAEKSSAQSLEAAQARQKAGTATRADVLQAQTAHSQDRLTRTQAEGAAADAQGVLASTLGLRVDLSLGVAASSDFSAAQIVERDVPAMLALARRQRPDLSAAQSQVDAARQNITIQQSADRPTLSLSGSVGASQSVPGQDPRTGSIGLALNVPIYNGRRNAYQIELARRQLEAQMAAQARLQQDVDLEVWRAYQALRTQRQAVISAEDLAASARESHDVALGRYKSGVGTVTDLLTAQTALARADQQRIQSRYAWNLSKATLARALGVLERSLFDSSNSQGQSR